MAGKGTNNVRRGSGGGFFTFFLQLIGLVAVVALTVGATLYFVGGGPFTAREERNLNPVVIRAIRGANQLVTAQTQVDAIYTSSASSRLPGSEERIIYFAVYDVKAGVDLSQIKDSDITIDGDTVTIRLPAPYIVSQALDPQKSYVIAHEIGPTAAIGGASKDLLDTVLRNADAKAKNAVLSDDTLLKAAQENAQTSLKRLLTDAGVTNVIFIAAPIPTQPPRDLPTPVPVTITAPAAGTTAPALVPMPAVFTAPAGPPAPTPVRAPTATPRFRLPFR